MFMLSWRLSMITLVGLPVITAVSKLYGEFYGVRLFCISYNTLLLPSCSLWINGNFSLIITYYSAPDSGVEYCDERVCLSISVCVFVYLRSYLQIYMYNFHQFFMHVTYGCGSVLIWWHGDTLCTSGFWMISYLLISHGCSTSPPSWSTVHMQPWTWL